ncbi:hypothetical protein GCM10009630_04880 [Kribbella jejuensis]
MWLGIGRHWEIPGKKDDQPVPEWAEGLALLLTVYPDLGGGGRWIVCLWISGEEHPGGEGCH